MFQLSSFARGLLLAAPLTLVSALASAQSTQPSSDLQRVEISGRRPGEVARLDVQASCPGIAKMLQEQLAYPMERDGEAGTSRVYFRVGEDGLSEIETRGGPLSNRKHIRRVMHGVDCKSEAHAQLFTFLLSFTPEGQTRSDGAPQRVALLEQ